MKVCTKCKITKEEIAFYKKSAARTGLTSECKTCIDIRNTLWAKNNAEKKKLYDHLRYVSNPEPAKARSSKRAKEFPELVNAQSAKQRRLHPERGRKFGRVYRQTHPGKVNFHTAKRRACKLQRTPSWLSKEDIEKIREFYVYARLMTDTLGIKHTVDHIIPLKGKTISGLHVPWNLQILTVTDNSRKHKKFDGTYENEGWRKCATIV